jgi:hypothetical protein
MNMNQEVLQQWRVRLYDALQRTEPLAGSECGDYLKIVRDGMEELLQYVRAAMDGRPQPLGDRLPQECEGVLTVFGQVWPA